MPQVAIGAAIGATVSTGFALVTGKIALSAAASFFIASFAQSFVIGAVMQALQDKQDFNALDRGITLTNRNSTASRKLIYGKRRVGGTIVNIGTSDEKDENGDVVKANQFLHIVIALAGHRVDGIERIYFNEEVISSDAKTFTNENAEYSFALDSNTNYSDADILIKALPGGVNQAVPAELIAAFPDDYTSDHQLNETAYLYVRIKYDQEIFSSGIPNITAEVRGKHVNDPRDSTYAYSNNAALCVLDYLIETNYGLGAAIPELDLQTFIDAANVCDEAVTLEAGGTEPRYTVNGVIDSAVEPRQNIENMLTSMNGKLVYTKGLFQIFPGVYRTPSETITMEKLTDSVSISTKTSTRQLFNGVKGTFADPSQSYVLTEYPSIESATYQAIDGYTSLQTLDLPFTTSSATAQRLAKLALNRSRQEITVSMQCNLSAIDVVPGDFIYVTNPQLGFNEKVFEVVNAGLSFGSDGTLGVAISAQEASAATFDWQASDEQAIITNNPIYNRVYEIQPPTNLVVTSTAVINSDGTAQSKWTVSFTGSVSRNVQHYELQWKRTSDTVYTSDSIGTVTEFEGVGGVVPGLEYDVRVRAVSTNGATSPFASKTHVMAGDTTAPATPSGLSADGVSRAIVLDWTANTEPDIRHYLVYEGSSTQFSNATLIATVLTDNFTRNALPDSSTRYYWVRAVDYSGNQSGLAGPVSATTDAAIAVEDTKAANGYVYYQISTSSRPARPSASSYNFNTGSFFGLSSNWSIQPPNVNGSDVQYWASSWSVLDENGSQTITFSTPFRSFQFDGLVTFTNLSNELSDPNSSEITTIDGGLIKTGVVEANRIELDGNTIEAGASGIRIKNLGVDTLQIADNAVTVPTAQTVSSLVTGNGFYQEIQWLNYTVTEPMEVLILWSGNQLFASGVRNWNTQLQIDGSLKQLRGGAAVTVGPTHLYSESLSAGTYRIAIWWFGQDSTVRVDDRSLVILGAKK